jgi:GH15 family glucan-1,4-alpha-glucosidase
VHAEICRRGFHRKLGSFVRDFHSTILDASLLRLAQVGFLRPGDPRIHGTVDAIGKYLLRDGLVYRHRSGGTRSAWLADEPAILVCSLWYADALVLLRRKREAIETLERVLALRNDLGLLAEAFDPDAGELSGNFPQTLSHLAVVNTALNLEGRRGPAWRRNETPKPG